jgi:4-azaleucine resistance transporter AzlC
MKTIHSRPLLRGMRDTLPLLPGVVPFGLVYGVAARGAHLPPLLAQAMSCLVFAGSAQFAVVQLVSAGTPAALLVVTALLLNLRHLLYSASLAPSVQSASAHRKAILAYLLTDEVYGVTIGRIHAYDARRRVHYVLGSGLTLWSSWQVSTLVGLLVGAQVPVSWSLDFTATLTFIALAVPLLKDRAGVACSVAAAVTAALALHAPLKLGLVVATLVGVAAGMVVETKGARRQWPQSSATAERREGDGERVARPAE